MSSIFSQLESGISSTIGNAATTAEKAGLGALSNAVGLSTPSTVQTPSGQTVVNTSASTANQPSMAAIIANIPMQDWAMIVIGVGLIGWIILHKRK